MTYKKFESFMLEHGFHKTQVYQCVFVKRYNEGNFLILLLYVDDMLVVGKDTKRIAHLSLAHYFLSLIPLILNLCDIVTQSL